MVAAARRKLRVGGGNAAAHGNALQWAHRPRTMDASFLPDRSLDVAGEVPAGAHQMANAKNGHIGKLKADEPLAFVGHGALDEVQVVEGDAGAHGDEFEGVIGDVARDADLPRHEAFEVAQEGDAAGEDDAAVDDVGGELRRRAFEDGAAGAASRGRLF
jgi:hypothetical protein